MDVEPLPRVAAELATEILLPGCAVAAQIVLPGQRLGVQRDARIVRTRQCRPPLHMRSASRSEKGGDWAGVVALSPPGATEARAPAEIVSRSALGSSPRASSWRGPASRSADNGTDHGLPGAKDMQDAVPKPLRVRCEQCDDDRLARLDVLLLDDWGAPRPRSPTDAISSWCPRGPRRSHWDPLGMEARLIVAPRATSSASFPDPAL